MLQDLYLLRQLEAPRLIIKGEELQGCGWKDWAEIQTVFGNHVDLPLQQWWEKVEDLHFESGSVRIGWREDKIYLLANMEDQSVVTTAHRNGERLWELGDVVEIFVKSPYQSEYYELQVAPNGCVLQLKYPDPTIIIDLRSREMTRLNDFILHEEIFPIRLRIQDGGWNLFVEIPGKLFFADVISLLGYACQISVSRYDHWADARPPQLSSISPHSQLDFHRQRDWGLVQFVRSGSPGATRNEDYGTVHKV